jgi:hypothetical protein
MVPNSPPRFPLRVAAWRLWKFVFLLVGMALFAPPAQNAGGEPIATDSPVQLLPPDVRFSLPEGEEIPDFQRHVVPLLGRLGCNGRSCHGSLQGQGGLQLSLFGYDFAADFSSLHNSNRPRVIPDDPEVSLLLKKPSSEHDHEGGQRFSPTGWEYQLLSRWIEAGAEWRGGSPQTLVRLEVTPSEIVFPFGFHAERQSVPLQVVAVWEDGTREDVTPLCRFQSNDPHVAEVTEAGTVSSTGQGDTHVVVFYDRGVTPIPILRPVSEQAGEQYPKRVARTHIDRLLQIKQRKLGIVPSAPCSDEEFLRRVTLDLTGSLPTAGQVTQFLADPSPEKRSEWIEQLLNTPAYAAWWTTILCDFTGNNSQQLANASIVRGAASQQWYDWIHARVADNVPYDELVSGIVLATSREAGETYLEYCSAMSEISRPGSETTMGARQFLPHYWSRRDFRQPAERAIHFAYAFMGVRLECAQCHKHPFDQWSKEDFDQFTRFFNGVNFANNSAPANRRDFTHMLSELGLSATGINQVRGDLVRKLRDGYDVPFPEVFVAPRGGLPGNRNRRGGLGRGGARQAKLLGGEVVNLNRFSDPRQPLWEWLRNEGNPYFARSLVNRVWGVYFGQGIVDPPDDLNLANPPSNGPLLDYLTQGFVRHGYDLHWLHLEILKSDAYQVSWRPNDTNQHDRRNFSRFQLRRLPAEVAYDAIQLATSSDHLVDRLQSDMSQRAIGSLSLMGPPRGRDVQYALNLFGRSTRSSSCDCDRSDDPNLLQTVFLQNDRKTLELLDRPRDSWLAQIRRESTLAPRGLGPRGRNGSQPDGRLRPRFESREFRDEFTDRSGEGTNSLSPLEDRSVLDGNSSNVTDPVTDYVKQAYLRTLSRYPTESELSSSRRYIAESPDPISGLRDVMWALLNTKEFILNH